MVFKDFIPTQPTLFCTNSVKDVILFYNRPFPIKIFADEFVDCLKDN